MDGWMLNNFVGFDVRPVNHLPVEVTYEACDIRTRREFIIQTGRFIHFLKKGTIMFVSQEMFDLIKKQKS